jgi:hypothetical protein
MKGLLFGGCSFTWGQGLYFYSDLPSLKYPTNEYTFRRDELTEAHLRYKDTCRYPRLVANYFKTFELVKEDNGGSEDVTFDFLRNRFNNNNISHNSNIISDKFNYEDIEFIIIQTSQIWRNRFYFELNGILEYSNMTLNVESNSSNLDKLLLWMGEKDKTTEDVIKEHFEYQYKRFLDEVKFYESKNIKVLFLSWENELYDILKNDEYLMSKFIKLQYDGREFNTIRDLHEYDLHLKIKFDYKSFGENTPDDHHPSKLCHEVIANSIIKKIKNT